MSESPQIFLLESYGCVLEGFTVYTDPDSISQPVGGFEKNTTDNNFFLESASCCFRHQTRKHLNLSTPTVGDS